MKKSVIQRIEEKTHKTADCWNWEGAITGYGYGIISINNRHHPVHRVVWELSNGPIPSSDLYVCHHCDNRRCIRLDHLFLGTAKDNYDDMVSKGRNSNKPKLTEQQVRAIRVEYIPFVVGAVQLAKKYGVCRKTIQDIVAGKTYTEWL